ncbi:hypothetical protein D7Y13_00670 [Corallococcus praedator]|uniref:Uncharacterized protein n=1 Tax=Corallococcus praedator TaxID=2316724 RepID=A0ABX9QU16_9BACT|nr:hypothetical protein D7X75_02490 [Corallococcus sp. CA031C]RKI17639.1 hypothetical protein D7Y13_00670 [Corallococcus praedator]
MTLESRKRDALRLSPLDDDDAELVLSVGNGRYPYDETHDGTELFWHATGSGRTVTQVFAQGFNTAWARETPVNANAGKVVWRCSDDDIELSSGVCLARDIRGAAFFPLTDDQSEEISDSYYIYAVAPRWTTNTYKAQKIAEAVETNRMEGSFLPKKKDFWMDKDRWTYDPNEDDSDNACCVWQFNEHATLVVTPAEIVGCWEATRSVLVDPGEDHRQKAGIRFSVGKLARGNKRHDLFSEAAAVVEQYKQVYPKKGGQWLSYHGIVTCTKICESKADAKLLAKQVQAVVARESALNDRGDY